MKALGLLIKAKRPLDDEEEEEESTKADIRKHMEKLAQSLRDEDWGSAAAAFHAAMECCQEEE
jgi:hypothetical protein